MNEILQHIKIGISHNNGYLALDAYVTHING